MHKIKIEGYAFGTSEIVDMDLGFYVYPSSPGIINVTYSVTGTYFPTKLEIAEGTDGNIWIRFNPGIYKMRFHVSHYNSYGLHTADMSKNWEMDMTQGSLSGMAYFKNFHQDSDGWQMKRFMTTFTAEEGYKNSPVSIRERGYARNSNLDPRWSPNLNFHWENRISRNLWMDADGVLNYGAYDSAGNPTANGKMKMQDLLLDSGANYWPLQINSRAVSGDGQNVGGMAIFPDGDINKRIEYSGKRSGNFRIWTSGNMGDVIWSDGANVHVAGSLFQNSDRRLKTNINGISNALDGIRRIDGKTYNWKTDENGAPVTYGLIAQELESVFPEMVSTADDGTKSVSYNGLIPVLVEATKELDDKVEDIEVKTDRHELKIQEYESRILTLEDQVREYEKRQAGDTAIAPAQPAANDEVMADNEEAHEPAVKPSSGLTRFYGS